MGGDQKLGAELGLLALVLITGLILASPAVLLLALPIVVHVIFGMVLLKQGRDLSARRSLSSHRIHEGDSVDVELVVQKHGEGLDLALVTEDVALAEQRIEGPVSLAERVSDDQSLLLSYTARPHRGYFPLEQVSICVRDLLGFVTWEGNLPCRSPLWVLPRYEVIGRVGLFPHRTLSVPGTAGSRRGGVGVQFFATRPYIPGDDLRRLNWKALARRHQTVVNLYEEERAAEVTVVLDGRDRVYQGMGGRELFDQAVRACAALCDSVIRDGHRTGLLLYGERLEWIFSGGGRVQWERLLQGLAKAQLGFSEAFADLGNLPARLFPGGSSIIVVSPFAPGDEQALGMLRARGYDVLALVPAVSLLGKAEQTPEGLARRFLALERELMLQIIMSAGVRLAAWDPDCPLRPLVKAAWGRRM
ncbi:MAG: DUF58 domain-containing protein [Dehalococcoidia bacterium]|nr:DUF58 domain-containing protein [Dehalococcoidia bacterium]